MIKNTIIIFFTSILIFSCISIREDDSIDLGDNYRFIQDSPQTIIYHASKEYEGSGIEVIPPNVLSYKFNSRYIIARSQVVDEVTGSADGKPIVYWIIDKRLKGNSVEPMDSISFYGMLKTEGIEIDF